MSFLNWFMTGEMVNNAALHKYARTFAANSGLSVVLQENVDQPCTDGKTLYMPMPQYGMNENDLVLWLYKFFHEIGHNDPEMTDIFTLLRAKNLNVQSFIGYMLNLVDDHRQELHGHGIYTGRDAVLGLGRKLFLDAGEENRDNYGQIGADAHRLAGETMWVWDAIIRSEWMPQLTAIGEAMAKHLNEQQCEWLNKLLDGSYESTLKSGMDADQEYDLVMRILTEVFEFDAEQEEENATNQEQEGGESSEGEGKEGHSETGGDPEAHGSNTRGGGSGESEEDTKEATAPEVNYSDLMMHEHKQEGEKGEYGLHINYDGGNTEQFDMLDVSQYIIYNYTDSSMNVNPDSHTKRQMETLDTGAGLSGQVRRLLMAKRATRYQHGLKRGRISPKSIFRGAMRDSGEYQRKVFKKKIENDMLNTAITVMMDCSGSMEGAKFTHAGKATILLNEAIGKLNVPLEIVGFTDDWHTVIHALWKTFDKSVSSEDLLDRIADSHSRTMSSNSDGESIMWGYNRLLPRKEKRKMMIVLSDGSPATVRGDADWHTRMVVDNIEKQGIVEMYGIGIMDSNVKRIYKKHQVISHANELEAALLKVIEEHIINS